MLSRFYPEAYAIKSKVFWFFVSTKNYFPLPVQHLPSRDSLMVLDNLPHHKRQKLLRKLRIQPRALG